jgi:hypothetical protein
MKNLAKVFFSSHFDLPCVVFCILGVMLFVSPNAFAHHAKARQIPENPLSVHEWGTFTSIAGADGAAMDWLPLTGSTDLPSFVEHLGDVHFKGGLRGTVRLETPVLYFYAPQETTVSVHVSFLNGLITEWYPHASSISSVNEDKVMSLYDSRVKGGVVWNSVRVQPGTSGDFPSDSSQNHYYAARETSAAPLTVNTIAGSQRERFLFYRGVSNFSPPLSATISADGTVFLQNNVGEAIPNAILFERRGTRLGYRVLGPLADQAAAPIPSSLDGSSGALFSDLEGMLISQGLYPDEAHAMLETWKNSWFEEGSRVIYLVPRPFVDFVLPLRVSPSPSATARVFVGRLELVTPATQQAVESALASGDRTALAHYSRFLEPILRVMLENSSDPTRTARLEAQLQKVYIDLYSRAHP